MTKRTILTATASTASTTEAVIVTQSNAITAALTLHGRPEPSM